MKKKAGNKKKVYRQGRATTRPCQAFVKPTGISEVFEEDSPK